MSSQAPPDPFLTPFTVIPNLEVNTESTRVSSFQVPNSDPEALISAQISDFPITPPTTETYSFSEFNASAAEDFPSWLEQENQTNKDYSQTTTINSVEDDPTPNPNQNPVYYYENEASPSEVVSSALVVTKMPRPPPRSSELVRITELEPERERNFRDTVRKTRMIYDSLRIFLIMEDHKEIQIGKKPRSDSKASKAGSVMKDRYLWLNRDKRIVGSIPGIQIGDIFFFRFELCILGLHGHPQRGIDFLPGSLSSNGEPIATSVIVSGGYEDDDDQGDVIIYTGEGGQDKTGKHCEHQLLKEGNLGLKLSMEYEIEVRVFRGFQYENSVSSKVYVYDGLYKIVDSWFDVGKSGFGVFKFKLTRIEGQAVMGSSVLKLAKTLKTVPLSVRPRGYISFDISSRKEKVSVYLYNDIDGDREPLHYEYLAQALIPAGLRDDNLSGCNCIMGCSSGCICETKNGGEFAYDYSGNLIRQRQLIHECGPACKCPPNCRNRVTQKGLRNSLEVFRSVETGWGVRSLDILHAGAFICEYTGVVLTKEQADIANANGDPLVYPGQFNSKKWEAWGDLSPIYDDYIRPSDPEIPPFDFALDVSKKRNVACYLCHSTDPNVMVQYVLYDHNSMMYPRVMLFAAENIPPMTELSVDYGVAAEEGSDMLAICN